MIKADPKIQQLIDEISMKGYDVTLNNPDGDDYEEEIIEVDINELLNGDNNE